MSLSCSKITDIASSSCSLYFLALSMPLPTSTSSAQSSPQFSTFSLFDWGIFHRRPSARSRSALTSVLACFTSQSIGRAAGVPTIPLRPIPGVANTPNALRGLPLGVCIPSLEFRPPKMADVASRRCSTHLACSRQDMFSISSPQNRSGFVGAELVCSRTSLVILAWNSSKVTVSSSTASLKLLFSASNVATVLLTAVNSASKRVPCVAWD
mmetsp:Transcript_21004/g.30317  ORF Transcript_21004/g.30317 Transcript_21004/m.30317 type:complete len:211 (+) Transcript_21004:456-1088(+)